MKMATMQQKAFCVLEYARCLSVVTVQRAFRREYEIAPPGHQSILRWYRNFKTTGVLEKRKSTGRPRVSDATVDAVRQCFVQSPQQSTSQAGRALGMPQQTVWKVLRKRLRFKPYRIHLLQKLRPNDCVKRLQFCNDMQEAMEGDGFANRLVFSDEATFYLSGKVNRHNIRIWGTENPHATVQHERDSPKLNVFCAVSSTKVYGPFFFNENTVTGISYLDMLQLWLMPQLTADSNNFIYQQDGAPPHWHNDVRGYLNEELPHRWIGRCAEHDLAMFAWPPNSPDLTPCDFYFWGYIKDTVFVPPLPATLAELRRRITAAVNSIDRDTLQSVWTELDYRLDICRVTRGAHIEHL